MLTSFPKRSFPKKEKKKEIIIFFVLGPTQVHIRAPKMIRKIFYLNLIGFPKKKKTKLIAVLVDMKTKKKKKLIAVCLLDVCTKFHRNQSIRSRVIA